MYHASIRASRALARPTRRRLATEKGNRAALNYLEAWVGSPSLSEERTSDAPPRPNARSHNMPPLLLSGSSYLMPTLRIERKDTPESISSRIAMALEDSYPASVGTIKSMLRGKPTSSGVARWHVPIVLDLSALVPDGSPHYTPPQRGLLAGLVQTLQEYGIRVVGVTNTPTILEEEAVHDLGLPSFMSKGRVLDRQSAAKVRVEDVIQMVRARSLESGSDEILSARDDSQSLGYSASGVATIIEDTYEPKKERADHASADEALKTPLIETMDGDKTLPLPRPEGGTHVYHGSIRSGQQVAAHPNKSLIVVGSVNSGGEVLSDRDIIVLGKLRGRALAGLAMNDTNSSARIFSTSFDPELICIGDTFTTVDDVRNLGLHRPGEAAMVSLDSRQELVFEHISL